MIKTFVLCAGKGIKKVLPRQHFLILIELQENFKEPKSALLYHCRAAAR